MKLPLLNRNRLVIKLENIDSPSEVSGDVIFLYIGGFCGNSDIINEFSEIDKSNYQRIHGELSRNNDSIEIRMFQLVNNSKYKYVMVVAGHDSEYYRSNHPNRDAGSWKDFDYAIPWGALELAESIGIDTLVLTHIASPPDENSILAQGAAIGHWWDRKQDGATLGRIIFTGCGINDSYLNKFKTLNSNQNELKTINGIIASDGMSWSYKI